MTASVINQNQEELYLPSAENKAYNQNSEAMHVRNTSVNSVAGYSSYYDMNSYHNGGYSHEHHQESNGTYDNTMTSPPGAENIAPVYNSGYPSPENLQNTAYWGHSQSYGYPNPFMPLATYTNTSDDRIKYGPNGKPKRRRVATIAQRRAANIRERRRMFNLNEAFDVLRKQVPTFAYEKRLSRIETLRLAITYISFMAQIVDGKEPSDIKLHSKGLGWNSLKKIADDANEASLNSSMEGDDEDENSVNENKI
ncbi:unnamed protein product [Owenia fusiformis]|uniref:BHLH domain-containing protein n=1 Tax=Owenia fusiformis TaxID=6347 RepID=A0A8S4P8L2_OWEFU|nr:unnamed protein product [Owenia fusiformis]